jgi:hypothetical protein
MTSIVTGASRFWFVGGSAAMLAVGCTSTIESDVAAASNDVQAYDTQVSPALLRKNIRRIAAEVVPDAYDGNRWYRSRRSGSTRQKRRCECGIVCNSSAYHALPIACKVGARRRNRVVVTRDIPDGAGRQSTPECGGTRSMPIRSLPGCAE